MNTNTTGTGSNTTRASVATSTGSGLVADLGPQLLTLARFDPDELPLSTWKLLFDNYVEMAGVPVESRRHLLLNSLVPKAFQMIVSLCRPSEPSKFTLTELFQKLKIAYSRQANKRAERANFFMIKQKPGQNLVEFANLLRNQSVKCDFPDNVIDDQLCSAFSANIESEATRRFLFDLPESSVEKFDTLLEAAVKYEASQADARRAPNSYADILRYVDAAVLGLEVVVRGSVEEDILVTAEVSVVATRTLVIEKVLPARLWFDQS